jgi:hypothetical protein
MEKDSIDPSPYLPTARRFVGYALRHDAQELYNAMNTPTPEQLARSTVLHLTAQGIQERVFTVDNMIRVEDRTILTNAIEDICNILHTSFAHHQPAGQPEALSIVRDPRTILAIAKLALRSEEELITLTNPRKRHTDLPRPYYMAPDFTHLEANPHLSVSNTPGCPMAGHHGEVAPDPLFIRFVPWAGELAVRSLYLHTYKKDR